MSHKNKGTMRRELRLYDHVIDFRDMIPLREKMPEDGQVVIGYRDGEIFPLLFKNLHWDLGEWIPDDKEQNLRGMKRLSKINNLDLSLSALCEHPTMPGYCYFREPSHWMPLPEWMKDWDFPVFKYGRTSKGES